MPTSRGADTAAEDHFLGALYRGGELLASGKIVEAREHLEKAHALEPKNEKAQNLLGLTYFKLGLFDLAAHVYELLVAENPTDPTLRVNLGLVFLKTNDLERSVKEFEAATDLEPGHKKAHNYLGLALAQRGDYRKAREHFHLAGSDQMAEKMARALGPEEPEVAPLSARASGERERPLPPPAAEHLEPPDPPPDVEEATAPMTLEAIPALEAAVEPPPWVEAVPEGEAPPTSSETEASAAALASDWSEHIPDAPPGLPEFEIEESADLRPPEATALAEEDPAPMMALGDEPLVPLADALEPLHVRLEGLPPGPAGLEGDALVSNEAGIPAPADPEAWSVLGAADAPLVAEVHQAPIAGGWDTTPWVTSESALEEPRWEAANADPGSAEAPFAGELPHPLEPELGGAEWDASSEPGPPPPDAAQPPIEAPQGEAAYRAEGEPYPVAGELYPAEGGPYPAEGGPYPAEGGPYPAEGGPYPAEGGPYPAEGEAYGAEAVSPSGDSGEMRWDEASPLEATQPHLALEESSWVMQPASEAFSAPSRGLQARPSVLGPRPSAGFTPMPTRRLEELGQAEAWEHESAVDPFQIGPAGLAVTVSGEMLLRMEGLVAVVGGLSVVPENRRRRGRPTDEPFGEGPEQLHRVSGHGVVYLEASGHFHSLDLADQASAAEAEGAYLREPLVFAFEESVAFDNGHLTAEDGSAVELVHLVGSGKVLLKLEGVLQAMPIPLATPTVVPLARLVGWFGRVTPRLVGFGGQWAVELTGDGFALLLT